MSRKAFLIWGLVIISLLPVIIAILQYLGFSKLIAIKSTGVISAAALLIATPIAFGTILHLRFKEIGRRKRILALCIFLYLFTLTMTGPSMLYNDLVITNSGAESRFYGAIAEWAKTNPTDSIITWTLKQKLDYILVMLPMSFINQWGLFALLWFGSLDPRTPSKTRLGQFFKTGFQLKKTPPLQGDFSELVHG